MQDLALSDVTLSDDPHDNADSDEKRAVGAVWASRSGGRCLFVMPTGSDFSGIANAVRVVYGKG